MKAHSSGLSRWAVYLPEYFCYKKPIEIVVPETFSIYCFYLGFPLASGPPDFRLGNWRDQQIASGVTTQRRSLRKTQVVIER